MELRIRQYIERAFADVPKTAKNNELKESLYSDLIEKYQDLLGRGKTEEEACGEVIAGIGDLSELTQGLIREAEQQHVETVQERRRSALFVSIAVGMYILSPLAFMIFDELFHKGFLAICAFFVMVAVATGLLIYYNMTKPAWKRQQEKRDDVERWLPEGDRQVYGAISGALWVITTAAYLLISFTYGGWRISWVIFLIAAAIQLIIRALFASRIHK